MVLVKKETPSLIEQNRKYPFLKCELELVYSKGLMGSKVLNGKKKGFIMDLLGTH